MQKDGKMNSEKIKIKIINEMLANGKIQNINKDKRIRRKEQETKFKNKLKISRDGIGIVETKKS